MSKRLNGTLPTGSMRRALSTEPFLVFRRDEAVAQWAGKRAGVSFSPPYRAIGVGMESELIGAAVYNNFNAGNVDLSVVTSDPRAGQRRFIKAMFHYPFMVCGARRVSAKTRAGNLQAQKGLERLGFVKEGVLRQWFDGEDAFIYGMCRHECKWLEN